MMNSRAYRQSSRVTDQKAKIAPENRLLSRMPVRRLDAEALRDSLLSVSGLLDRKQGGPPEEVIVHLNGLVEVIPNDHNQQRRSVYLQYRRTQIPSFMSAFDYPIMGPNCVSRTTSTVSPQALMLKNDKQVRSFSTAFARRILTSLDGQQSSKLNNTAARSQAVRLAYNMAMTRRPSPEEMKLGVEALALFQDSWQADEPALSSYCHTIFNSAAFLYVD